MPRKGPAPRRELVADPIHRSVIVTQLINKVMLHGKRNVAEKIVYDAMEIVQSKLDAEEQVIDIVKRAIDNVKPPLEVRSRRVGGATYQVPVEVRPRRSTTRRHSTRSPASCAREELPPSSTWAAPNRVGSGPCTASARQ